MAIWGQITVDELGIYSVSADPSVDGFVAPVGSIALLDDDVNARMWIKSGTGNTAWSIIPRLPNASALTVNRFVFPDANGFLTTTPRALWDGTGRFSFGLNAPTVPQSTIHLDRGNAVGSHIRMTAGTTTGQAAGDGTEFGIDDAGNAEIRQYENSAINFYTNNLNRASISPAGVFRINNSANTSFISITPGWFGGNATWIDLDTTGPSGIGSGGPGVNPWISYVSAAGNWFTNSNVGDIAYRNIGGRLLFGTSGGNFNLGLLTSGDAVFSNAIRVGATSDTTNGNIQYTSNELLGRVNGTWRNLAIVPIVQSFTTGVSTTSGTFSTVGTMTVTPGAGTYWVVFSCTAVLGISSTADISLFVNGVEDQTTRRTIGAQNTGLGGISAMAGGLSFATVATVGAGQVIDVRFRENDNQTFTVSNGVLALIPIAR